MAQRLKVIMDLSNAHLLAFQAIAIDRRTTVNKARRWLAHRGYQISRNAVWKFIKREKAHQLPPLLENAGDSKRRTAIATCATRLTGRDLERLASIAAVLARDAAKVGTVRPPA